MPISKEGMNIYEQRPWLNDDIQNRTVLQNNLLSGGTLEITENGTYNVSDYSVAEVNVSGGGSSDFSTAEVTVVNVVQDKYYTLRGIIISEDRQGNEYMSYNTAYSDAYSGAGDPLTVVLFKGKGGLILEDGTGFSVSGNATLSDGEMIITGDCTITGTGTGEGA